MSNAVLAPPFPQIYWADPFGDWPQWRKDMGLGPHRGKDFNGLPHETPIPASASGVCVLEGWNNVLGWYVVIRYQLPDGSYVYFGYCHLATRTTLRYGVWVVRGQTVGYLGMTGSAATGDHLHLTASWFAGDPGSVPVIDPVQFFSGTTTAAEEATPVVNNETKELDMRLAWDTGGTGWLVTPDGWHGLPSMQVYNLFNRLINAPLNKPDTFLRAEVDLMNYHLTLLRSANQIGVQIDGVKLASAIADELNKIGINVTVENLQDVEAHINEEQLAAAYENAVPRIVSALIKKQGEIFTAAQ